MATMSTSDHLSEYDDMFAEQDTLLCFPESPECDFKNKIIFEDTLPYSPPPSVNSPADVEVINDYEDSPNQNLSIKNSNDGIFKNDDEEDEQEIPAYVETIDLTNLETDLKNEVVSYSATRQSSVIVSSALYTANNPTPAPFRNHEVTDKRQYYHNAERVDFTNGIVNVPIKIEDIKVEYEELPPEPGNKQYNQQKQTIAADNKPYLGCTGYTFLETATSSKSSDIKGSSLLQQDDKNLTLKASKFILSTEPTAIAVIPSPKRQPNFDKEAFKTYSSLGSNSSTFSNTLLPSAAAESATPTRFATENQLEQGLTMFLDSISSSSGMPMEKTLPQDLNDTRFNTSSILEPNTYPIKETSQCSHSETLSSCSISATSVPTKHSTTEGSKKSSFPNNNISLAKKISQTALKKHAPSTNLTSELSSVPVPLVEKPGTSQLPVISSVFSLKIPSNLFDCSEEVYQFYHQKCTPEIQKIWDEIRLKREKCLKTLNKLLKTHSNGNVIPPAVHSMDGSIIKQNNDIKRDGESMGKIKENLGKLNTIMTEKNKIRHKESQINFSITNTNETDINEATTTEADKQARLKKKKPKKNRVETEITDKDTWVVNNNCTEKQTIITLKRKVSCDKRSLHQNENDNKMATRTDEFSPLKIPRIINDSTKSDAYGYHNATSHTQEVISRPKHGESSKIPSPNKQDDPTKTKETSKRKEANNTEKNKVPDSYTEKPEKSKSHIVLSSSNQYPTKLIKNTPLEKNAIIIPGREIISNDIDELHTQFNQKPPLEITVQINGSVPGMQTQSSEQRQTLNMYNNIPYFDTYHYPNMDRRVDMSMSLGMHISEPVRLPNAKNMPYTNGNQTPVYNSSYQSRNAPEERLYENVKQSPHPLAYSYLPNVRLPSSFNQSQHVDTKVIADYHKTSQMSQHYVDTKVIADYHKTSQMSKAGLNNNPKGNCSYANNSFTPQRCSQNNNHRNMTVNSATLNRQGKQDIMGYFPFNCTMPPLPPRLFTPPQYKF